ncbi:MAG: sulfatase [Planctomycetota bacterium]|nr:sulfatase [Planctomycetota bacterium]MDA1106177.1 sulfatase [Planctomycetota bacterium]
MNGSVSRTAVAAAVICAGIAAGVHLGACQQGVPSLDDRTTHPNLVVIYCDDMGWGDAPGFELAGHSPAWYTKQMPNLVALASQGAVFRHYYSAQPVCSASRAALLTGCYPNRVGIHGALFPDARVGIAADERTLAEMLHDAGYATLIAGKWHLGHLPEFNPTLHGFDEYYGIPYSNDMWPLRFGRKGFPELPLYDGTEVSELVLTMEDQGLLTGKLTRRACQFIRREAARGRPFFAYLPHPQPHAPIAAGPEFQPSDRRELYGAVMREIDWSVGEVMRALEDSAVADSTILVFTSDNGPWLSFGVDAGVTGGLREGKGTTFEGGVREPCIVRWPGHVPAGCVSDVPWMSIDLFATMAAIVGAPAPEANRPIDGMDVRRVWSCEAGAESPHEALWFYYHANHLEGVRSGQWKLSLPRKSRVVKGNPGVVDGKEAEYIDVEVPLALFDLAVDPTESVDVSAGHPGVVAELMVHVEAARADLGDALTGRAGVGRREPGRVAATVTP